MRHRNRIFLLGNVGNDPDVIDRDDFMVSTFSLYTSRSWTNAAGEPMTASERHTVKAFGALAGIVRDYVRKGNLLDVEGSLHHDTFTASDGVQRTATFIRAGEIILMPPRETNGHEEA